MCVLGSASAWRLVSVIDEHELGWNPTGFLLPLGVIMVLVKRTDLSPGRYPKLLLVFGVLFTLIGFFGIVENFRGLMKHGEIPQFGTILLPLGGGLIFGRPFCRAFVKLLIYMGLIGIGASWLITLLNGNFADPVKLMLPPAMIAGLIISDRLLYSERANSFFDQFKMPENVDVDDDTSPADKPAS